jgi:flagellin-like protein
MEKQMRTERRWRQKGRRGVSPIIATILLVAITVVLAAVLYILISGLTKGPGNTPLGTALAVNTPVASSGGTVYTMGIIPSSGLTPAGMNFEVVSSSGTILGSGTTVEIFGSNGCALATFTFATNTWAGGGAGTACVPAGTTTTVLTSGMQFQLTASGSLTGAGDKLVAVGVGTFSGQVQTALP